VARLFDLPDDDGDPSEIVLEAIGYSRSDTRLRARADDGRVFEWDARTQGLIPASCPRPRVPIGERSMIIYPQPEPPDDIIAANNVPWFELIEIEVRELELDTLEPWSGQLIGKISWHHDCAITAAAATPDGRVVIGDEQGRVLFLHRRRGIRFEPRIA
jgi:hypothetical protein